MERCDEVSVPSVHIGFVSMTTICSYDHAIVAQYSTLIFISYSYLEDVWLNSPALWGSSSDLPT